MIPDRLPLTPALADSQLLALTTLCPAVAALSEAVFGDVTVPASRTRWVRDCEKIVKRSEKAVGASDGLWCIRVCANCLAMNVWAP